MIQMNNYKVNLFYHWIVQSTLLGSIPVVWLLKIWFAHHFEKILVVGNKPPAK